MFAIPPLVAEPIFHIGSFSVTNSYINSSLAVITFIIIGLILRNRTSLVPKGIQNFAEWVMESMLTFVDQVTKNREKSMNFFPIVGGLFLFILFSNWVGLLPGTGSFGRWIYLHGHTEFAPLLRPANADLNMTLAMAALAVATSHILGVMAVGFFRYANKFVKLWDIVESFSKGGMSIMIAMVEFVVGLLEIVSEVAKLVSLSFRLFGNIFAGEVLLTVLAAMMAYGLPLPFMFLELLVGFIQALVFAMLTLTYFVIATTPIPEHAESH